MTTDRLEDADIVYDEGETNGKVVDTTSRRLFRSFTRGSFESGGRLFGPFWLNMSKRNRQRGLLVDGEPVAVLDYGQMAPRIIYGLAGVEPPVSDLYELEGLEDHRSGVKKVFNSMLFVDKPLTKFPKGTKAMFPDHVRVGQVTQMIEDKHPAIKDQFYKAVGHHAQFIESQIMIDVLLALKDEDVVALPIHDAVVVPRSYDELAKDIMLSVFHKHTGVTGVVDTEVDWE
jgi:hypothetical protein